MKGLNMRRVLREWIELKRKPWLLVFRNAFAKWQADGMPHSYNQFPNLGPQDTVLDFGGFRGDWTAAVTENSRCKAIIFEPHPRFAEQIRRRFAGNAAITVVERALGPENGSIQLTDDGDASSAKRTKAATVTGQLMRAAEFFESTEGDFAVCKVNIEGGEYDLLPAIIDCGAISRIQILQIQFHLFDKTDIARRDTVRERLMSTHDCVWNYPFVWERWEKR